MHDNFAEDTEKFFKFALSREGDDFLKWKAVENYIKCKSYQIQELCCVNFSYSKFEPSQKFCEILLNTLTEFRCDNKSLLTTLTDLIIIFSLSYLSKYMSRYKRECYVKTAINNLEEHTENSIFPENEGVQVFAALRNYQFMEIIVKYGLVKSFSSESLLLKARTKAILKELLYPTFTDDLDEDVRELMLNTLPVLIEGNLITNNGHRSFKRIFLTAFALQVILYKIDMEVLTRMNGFNSKECYSRLDNYMKCLKMYFEATIDPFITLKEMEHFLLVCLTHVNKTNLIEPYCKAFKELMPESKEKFQPRKLTELCRIHARQYLCRSNCTLPIAIENVKLPEKLKDFISFNLR